MGPSLPEPPGAVEVEVEPSPASRISTRIRVALGLATLVMLGLSWPLWVEPGGLPRVPFLAGVPDASARVSWLLFALLLTSIAAAVVGIAWRATLGLSLALLTVLVLQDQHRLQPWVYQYLMIGLLLATLSRSQGVRFTRWWLISLYFHSGLSKLDVSFCRELGLTFLATAVRPIGLHPEAWPAFWRVAAVLAMPAWEIAVAAALLFPRTRRLGLVGAVVIHTVLILILGPWGLRHSTIVLVWNAAMLVELGLLFGSNLAEQGGRPGEGTRLAPLVLTAFWIAVVLPLGERRGWLDAWPSHALYASHVERTIILLHEDELAELEPEARRHVRAEGSGPWVRLDLTGWSREARGVPVYPQGRACNGLAEGLAARYGGRLLIRVIQLGHADRWTGRRTSLDSLGLEAIRRQGDRYRINAHPAGASRSKPWS